MFKSMPNNKYWRVTQAIIFQLVWLSTVLGGNGLLFVPVALLLLHFLLTPTPKHDSRLLLLALPGLAMDGVLMLLGVYEFVAWPFWLVLLWFGFVLNFSHSLRLLMGMGALPLAIIGFLGGVYAYWMAWQLDAVALPYGGLFSCLLVGAYWAVLLPCLMAATKRWQKPLKPPTKAR